MKKYLSLIGLTAFCQLFTMCGDLGNRNQSSEEENNQNSEEKRNQTSEGQDAKVVVPTCLWPVLPGDYSVNLSTHTLSEREGDWEIDEFPRHVQILNNTNLPKKIHAIKNEDLCMFMDQARSILTNQGCSQSIPAIRIYLASNPEFTGVELIYEAVGLCHKSSFKEDDEFEIKAAGAPIFYKYTDSGFVPTDTSMVVLYRDNMKIRHHTTAGWETYHKDTDVRTLVFALQEIGRLIYDNDEPEVTVWNAICKKKKTGSNDSLHFHTVLLGPESIGPNKKMISSFRLAYANLAHMCPANCVTMKFTRLQTPND